MSKGKHLTNKERFTIEKCLTDGECYSDIARKLDRSTTAINDGVNKNGGRDNYNAKKANRKTELKQEYKKKECNKLVKNPNSRKYTEDRLENGWSPEAISARSKKESGVEYTSAKSIRKYIRKRPSFESTLFWKRNHKKSGPKREKGIYMQDPKRKFIDQRDRDFSLLSHLEYGHWEGDFIVSKHNSVVLLVLVEKHSRHKIIDILENRDNHLVNSRIVSLLKGYTVKSLTLDNDIAFRKWRDLEAELGSPVYFTHPYCSWEKGLVENANRWIRVFIPKKTDLGNVNRDELQSIEDYMNHLPRECLDGLTSYEVMTDCEEQKSVTSPFVDLPYGIIS